jgi:hypothetical protein
MVRLGSFPEVFMRKWFAVMVVLALLLAPAAARAQADVEFDSAVVQLWPEFDQPDMLVLCQFTLSAGTALPRDLDFRVPTSADVENLVIAVGQTQGTVSDQGIKYATREDGGWTVVTVQDVSGPAIRIEYYDHLETEGAGRHYVYHWPGEYATAALTVIFQQPVDATGLTLVPASSGTSSDTNGLL